MVFDKPLSRCTDHTKIGFLLTGLSFAVNVDDRKFVITSLFLNGYILEVILFK